MLINTICDGVEDSKL